MSSRVPSTAVRRYAVELHTLYETLVDEGFTHGQASSIVVAVAGRHPMPASAPTSVPARGW